jgi:hypothetical protein
MSTTKPRFEHKNFTQFNFSADDEELSALMADLNERDIVIVSYNITPGVDDRCTMQVRLIVADGHESGAEAAIQDAVESYHSGEVSWIRCNGQGGITWGLYKIVTALITNNITIYTSFTTTEGDLIFSTDDNGKVADIIKML